MSDQCVEAMSTSTIRTLILMLQSWLAADELSDITQVNRMSATQYNVRLPENTFEQIQWLINCTGMTQTQLAIVAFDRMYREERSKRMALQKAIEASPNNAVITYNRGVYTAVDGSLQLGKFIITAGMEGLPPTEHQEVDGIDAAIR